MSFRITNARHVIDQAGTTPWAILPDKLTAIADALAFRTDAAVTAADLEARGRAVKREAPALVVKHGVAVVPLFGTIMPRANLLTQFSGGTSAAQFIAEVRTAVEDDSVSAVVIDVNSPGGAVTGIPEAADALYALRGTKPIVAVANHLAASAAYWLAAQADTVVAAPSAEVGSVGVYLMHHAERRRLEAAGVDTTVVRAGKHKAEANPFEPLSDDARAELQRRVDEAYDQFVTALARGRSTTPSAVRAEYGEGRVLSATRALAAGMVDRIATLDDVVAEYASGRAGRRPPPRRRATSDDAPLASLAAADDAPPLTEPMATDPDVGPAVASDSPDTNTAPMAEETPVSATATPAPDGATNQRETREQRLAELVELRPEAASRLAGWITNGTSYADAKAELANLTPEPAPTATVAVGADRETQRPWESFGHFASAVATASMPGRRGVRDVDPRLFADANGINQAAPTEGGFAVPGSFASDLWTGLFSEEESLLARTDNYDVDGAYIEFPRVKDSDRSGSTVYGGVQAYWIAEGADITTSKPAFENMRLEPQELAALVPVTEKMLNKSPYAMGQYVDRMGRAAITHRVHDAIIRGDGVGKPQGLLNSGALITVAKETSQAADTLLEKNIAKMKARRVASVASQYVWLINIEAESELDTLSTTVRNAANSENVGGYSSRMYNGDRNTLGGLPIVWCDHCSALGDVGDVILAHLPSYAVGLRRAGVKAAQSMHLYFDSAQMAFRFMFDIDGQTWLPTAITPAKGATKSTVITLAAR